MKAKEYKNIKRWRRPSNYAGAEWYDYYSAGVGQSRDSDALERANFDAMLAGLGGETDTVIVVRESHWAVGWVEWLAIHETDEEGLATADRIQKRLQDYPVIDEDLWSHYENEECREVWESCYSPRERAEYLRQHIDAVYPYPEPTVYRMLRAAVKGSWYHAAQMLPSPSDLIA